MWHMFVYVHVSVCACARVRVCVEGGQSVGGVTDEPSWVEWDAVYIAIALFIFTLDFSAVLYAYPSE